MAALVGGTGHRSLAELEAAWGALGDKPRCRTLRHGETGLVMLRGRIDGTGQSFNVGEMTMTRAAVRLIGAAGEVTAPDLATSPGAPN